LPAIKLLRDEFSEAHLEILGYRHIIALAERRYYAQAARSIESGALSSFFARGAQLPDDLRDYFAGFDLIVSYLFDPDRIFETNVQSCGRARFIAGPGKITGNGPAAGELARPLEELGLALKTPAGQLFPNESDCASADPYLPANRKRIVAIHPGSGSRPKNWPRENWAELAMRLAKNEPGIFFVVIGGEADNEAVTFLRQAMAGLSASYVINQPLTQVAGILSRCHKFVGHDSGISHIAAAVGLPCTLMFGPTDPEVWAPKNAEVRVLRADSGKLKDVKIGAVQRSVERAAMG
jgi:heptosyltransferase-3